MFGTTMLLVAVAMALTAADNPIPCPGKSVDGFTPKVFQEQEWTLIKRTNQGNDFGNYPCISYLMRTNESQFLVRSAFGNNEKITSEILYIPQRDDGCFCLSEVTIDAKDGTQTQKESDCNAALIYIPDELIVMNVTGRTSDGTVVYWYELMMSPLETLRAKCLKDNGEDPEECKGAWNLKKVYNLYDGELGKIGLKAEDFINPPNGDYPCILHP